MPNVTVQARINPKLKEEAEAVFSAIGITTAEAIRIFLQQSVNSGGLPFQPSAKLPNEVSLAAMIELEERGGKVFMTTEDLFEDWNR